MAGFELGLNSFGEVATEADEADGTKRAQALLGHTTETMTEHYIRHKVGRKVRPLK